MNFSRLYNNFCQGFHGVRVTLKAIQLVLMLSLTAQVAFAQYAAPAAAQYLETTGTAATSITVTASDSQITLPIGGRSLDFKVGQIERILSGRESLYYYSAFGSSYGKDPIESLRGFLKVGARFSPRVWRLFNEIKSQIESANEEITDKELAKFLVESLSETSVLDSKNIVTRNQNIKIPTKYIQIVQKEIRNILNDFKIFKIHTKQVLDTIKNTKASLQSLKKTAEGKSAKRELDSLSKEFISSYIKHKGTLIKKRWDSSFDSSTRPDYENSKVQLLKLESLPEFRSLSETAKNIIELRAERSAAATFYSNYGGLYNNRDNSMVWYAAGPEGISRESFASIQKYFAKDGITFEFRPSEADRIYFPEVISISTKSEVNPNSDRLTYDSAGMAGNLIPEGLSRVYAKDQAKIDRVRSVFLEVLGQEALENSKISFHLTSEFEKNYHEDLESLIQLAHQKDIVRFKDANFYRAAGRTYFLTTNEFQKIKSGRAALYTYLSLDQSEFQKLLSNHAQHRPQPVTHLKLVQPTHEIDQSQTLIELRPEAVNSISRLLSSGEFNMSWVSRIYVPGEKNRKIVKNALRNYFKPHIVEKWGVEVLLHSSRSVSEKLQEETARLREGTRTKPALQTEKTQGPDNLRIINLFDIETTQRLRKELISAKNFGLPNEDLKKLLRPEEYNGWIKLQEFIISAAKQRQELTPEFVESLIELLGNVDSRQRPGGIRMLPEQDIHPGGWPFGKLWIFDRNEALHFLSLPFLEGPSTVTFVSPDKILTDSIKYKSSSIAIKSDLASLIDRYHARTDLTLLERAVYFQRDFISLHPLVDGNGRLSRALLGFLLMREDYEPPILGALTDFDMFLKPSRYLSEVKKLLTDSTQK